MPSRPIALFLPGRRMRFACGLVFICFMARGTGPFAAAQSRRQETADALRLSDLKRPRLGACDPRERQARTERLPRIETVTVAAPDLLALQIQAGKVVPSRPIDPYTLQVGEAYARMGLKHCWFCL
jgi:hypothetical protein